MSENTLLFNYKTMVIRGFLNAPQYSLSSLSSHRETMIQVDKLKRMNRQYEKKYPFGLVLPSGKRSNKTRGAARHQLNRQSKSVDKCLATLIEEFVVRGLGQTTKLKNRKVRGTAQKLVHHINAQIHTTLQKALAEAYQTAAKETLSGLSGLRGIRRLPSKKI